MKWKVKVGPEGIEKALDDELKKIVGVGHFEFRRARAQSAYMPMRMFHAFVDLVDRSGVVEKLHEWDALERKSNVGRKPVITFRAALVIELMTAFWNKGIQYQEVADTITHRLTRMQYGALGITPERVSEKRWYHRHWRAKSRILHLVDPYHATKKKTRLPLADAIAALDAKDVEREERLRWMIQALVAASVSSLPQRYRDAYSGDVALDSTRIRVQGRVHSRAFTLARKGLALDHPDVVAASRTLLPGGINTNVDFTAGTYTRKHGPKGNEPAHELDFVTMMDIDGYDEHPAFARLITGVSLHRPSEITDGPRLAMQAHSRLFEQRGHCAADRAFNNSEAENFQLPLRTDYWEMVFDYKKNQFGPQGLIPGTDLIVVDGAIYVNRMPWKLVWGIRYYKEGKPNPKTGELYTWADVQEIIRDREAYQMKRHGSMVSENRNGAQRYTYPDPRSYNAFDPVTGKPIQPHKNKLRGSIRVQPDVSFVRHLQRFPWGSKKWAKAYGQRNQVESSNADIKRSRFVDIEDPQKRSGRGAAFHGLASALMVMVHNLRVLVRALEVEHSPKGEPSRAASTDGTPMWMLGGSALDAVDPPDDEAAEAA
ncbi:hypothetical protein [Microbacterium sp. APC 3901]|uniref:hypothetical protein n=1 Tax=Microbacterium sp. APC 3901 TaxID=3035192 RepID=UPI0025B3A5D7|nr:hypothetical protein [Microbacterium sp. APC 3901]MDN3445994.1 hypothetical protein [Microbacterium sp. APC 3901]